MYNEQTKEMIDQHKLYSESTVLSILDTLITNFKNPVETSQGVWFNQNALVMMIEAFRSSTFRETADPRIRFFNSMNQSLTTADRKTYLAPTEYSINFDDKLWNALLQAARVEFIDDYKEDDFNSKFNSSQNIYGTAVVKRVKRSGKKHIRKVVDFPNIIWDQNNAEIHPMGEVFTVSLQDLYTMDIADTETLDKLKEKVRDNIGEDFDSRRAKIRLYEIHGMLPKDLFDAEASGLTQGMFIAAETEFEDRVVLYLGEMDEHPYHIYKREEVYNRSMGRGVAESLIHSQITTNEIGNLILEQLRATSKVIYQTSDTELDGEDLQAIDNLTLISHEEGSPITQVSTQPTSYSALQAFMNTVIQLGREQASIQDFSLGVGPKSNTSFASIQAAGKEADGQYSYFKERMFRFIRDMYKMKGGDLDWIMDYIKDEKAIEQLLTPYQKMQFKKVIAEKKAQSIINKQVEEGYLYVDDVDEVADFLLKEVKGKEYVIVIDEDIDRDLVRDKARVVLGSETEKINQRIRSLERRLQLVTSNPQAFPSSDPEVILNEILELEDLLGAYSINAKVSQSGQIAITPSGPQVAQEAGLVNSL